jgi:hypothetical protein
MRRVTGSVSSLIDRNPLVGGKGESLKSANNTVCMRNQLR